MSDLEDSISSLCNIGAAIQQLNKRSERQFGLSLVQWCLLKQLINMPAASAFSLAKAAGMHPSTLTQSLKRLERKKYLLIASDPQDFRKKLISITRVGKEALDKTSQLIGGWAKHFSGLQDELHHLRDSMQNVDSVTTRGTEARRHLMDDVNNEVS